MGRSTLLQIEMYRRKVILEGNGPGKCALLQNQVGRVLLCSLVAMRVDLMVARTGFPFLQFDGAGEEMGVVRAQNHGDGRSHTSALERGSRRAGRGGWLRKKTPRRG